MVAEAGPSPSLSQAPPTTRSRIRRWRHLLVRVVRQVVLLDDTPYRIAMGAATGTFCAVLPTLGQLLVGVFLARVLGGNLLVCMTWAWISNPLTLGPILYADYRIGAALLGLTPVGWADISRDPTGAITRLFWPMALGSPVLGLVLGILAFALMHPVVVAQQRRRSARIRAWAGR